MAIERLPAVRCVDIQAGSIVFWTMRMVKLCRGDLAPESRSPARASGPGIGFNRWSL